MKGTVKCPSCGAVHYDVDLKTKHRPWFALCGCGQMVTYENVIPDSVVYDEVIESE
jgi:hypothetical protein